MSLKRRFSLDSCYLDGSGTRRGTVFGTKKSSRRQSLDAARVEGPQLSHSLDSKMSLREQTIEEESLEGSGGFMQDHRYQKRNRTFHRLFPEVPEAENLTKTFTCALQKEVLYHGKLFVSERHVCFHSAVLLKATKVLIPVSSVCHIRKQNSTLSVLSLQTSSGEKFSFAHLRNREMCYNILLCVCSHAQDSPTSSPHFSSAENEGERGMVSSNSSVDESLEQEFSSIYLGDAPHVSREGPASRGFTPPRSSTDDDHRAVSWIWTVAEKAMSLFFFGEMKNLNCLYYVYFVLLLLLLLTSGYIGLRITALEEQLNSLGAQNDFSSHYGEYQET